MQGIYKITNIKNGHSYIGSSVDIKIRWKSHRSIPFNINSPEYEYPLYRAIRKYGLDGFNFEILEIVDSEAALVDIENKYYHKHNPIYNQGEPSVNNSQALADNVVKIDPKTLEVLAIYPSGRAASRATGIHAATINKACRRKGEYAGGFHWALEKDFNKDWQPYKSKKTKFVYQIDKETNEVVGKYESVKVAAEVLGLRADSISRVAGNNEKFKSYKGFIWKYRESEMN